MKNLRLSAFFILSFYSALASAQAYVGTLTGAAEAPPNASPATGSTIITFSSAANTLAFDTVFAGFTGNTTGAHIHCCVATPFTGTVGVATQTPAFSGFPLGVTSGTHIVTLDLTNSTNFNPPYITNNGGTTASATAALAAGLASGRAYLNLHSTAFPGGEIRAFLIPNVVFANGFEPTAGGIAPLLVDLSMQSKVSATDQQCDHGAAPSTLIASQEPK